MKARGHDVKLSVLRDGAEALSFRTQNSVTINFGLTTDTRNPVGGTRPEIFGQNEEATLTVEIEPDRTDFWALIDAQREANRPNSERTAVQIDVTCSVDLGDQGRVRYAFPGCFVRSASNNVGGRLERVKGSIELVCPEPRRI